MDEESASNGPLLEPSAIEFGELAGLTLLIGILLAAITLVRRMPRS